MQHRTIIVPDNVISIHGFRNSWDVINVTQVVVQILKLAESFYVAFEMTVVDPIKSKKRTNNFERQKF